MKRIEMKTLHGVRMVSLIAFVVSVATIASVVRVTSMRTHPLSALNSPGLPNSRGAITVHAAGRGNPRINLSDGRDVLTGYTGAAELQQVLEQNLARPLALSSADFDEDGVPDLIGGYAGPGGGIITLHRGNVDSIYPNAPEAQQRKANGTYTDSPFLSPAHVFEVAEAADFVGAGDFDADSHWDVVAAARGDNTLWLLSGDGRGNFRAAKQINLPGRVTTLVAGEINRADGLTDVVVGVGAADGPKALVFESPEGALRGKPEAYGLPAEATAMALGRLDDDYTMDLAVGAGNDLLVVYGRDRKLSLDEIRQAEVPQARIGRRSFPYAIKSTAIGDFTGDRRTGLSLLSDDGAVYLLSGSEEVDKWKSEVLALGPWPQASQLVCARVSSIPVDNLVLADSPNHKLHIIVGSAEPRLQASGAQLVSLDVEGEPMGVLPMRLNADALSDLVIFRNGQSEPSVVVTTTATTFTVTNTNDSGPGSLRQAILDANANAGLDTITFSMGSGPQTVTPLSPLPTITDAVTIDGMTQPGFAGNPIIELNGSSAGSSANGLFITGGNSVVRGFVINRFSNHGIVIGTNGGNVIAGNFIGTDVSGTADLGNSFEGVTISAANNTIGGTAAGARNVVSSNNGNGIVLSNSGATGNLVQGNYIGTDVNGTADLGNTLSGVAIGNAPNNTVGGTAAGARNVISGNKTGSNRGGIIIAASGATGNQVQGNFIGTDVNGTADLGNTADGVFISNAPNNTIGGTAPGARNVISGSNGHGIEFGGSGAIGNLVQGNYIGTDVSGTVDLSNSRDGVRISGTSNTVGGTTPGASNVISGNGFHGVSIGEDASGSGANGNIVQGNFIGTNATGSAALGNDALGVLIGFNASNTIVGGAAAGARNIISSNRLSGVQIQMNNSTANLVQGNFIGTNITGTVALGNAEDGMRIVNSPNNTVKENTIAFNNGEGVSVFDTDPQAGPPTGNAILSNSIFANGSLGIDLSNVFPADGVTSNDLCDPDTGANNLQNFPVLTSASPTSIQGTLNSTPNTTFTIQFFANTSCDPSGNGEGQTFIGSTTVTTDANCNASFTFPTSLSPGQIVTATATDPSNNTSEFSQCLAVPIADLSVTKTDSPDPVIRGNSITYTVIITNNGPSSAANVSLSDAVPSDTKFVSNSGAANWSCTNPPIKGMRTGTIACTTSSLASGASATFTIVVEVNRGTREGTSISNTATVSSSTSDPNTSNNSATATTAVIRR